MNELDTGKLRFLPSTYSELIYVDAKYANKHDVESDLILYKTRIKEFFGNIIGEKYDIIMDYMADGKKAPNSCLIKKGNKAWIMEMNALGQCATLKEVKFETIECL